MIVTVCALHGAGTGETCCQHSEVIGWYEERTHIDEELESKTPEE